MPDNPCSHSQGISAVVMIALGPLHAGEQNAASFGDGDILPGFVKYLKEHPLLAEGGGTIVADGKDWLALGIGVGVRSGKEQSEYGVWKLADHNALKGVVEVLEGSVYSGKDSVNIASGINRESSGIVREISGIVSINPYHSMTLSHEKIGCFDPDHLTPS